jgi:hypothetical protein
MMMLRVFIGIADLSTAQEDILEALGCCSSGSGLRF